MDYSQGHVTRRASTTPLLAKSMYSLQAGTTARRLGQFLVAGCHNGLQMKKARALRTRGATARRSRLALVQRSVRSGQKPVGPPAPTSDAHVATANPAPPQSS